MKKSSFKIFFAATLLGISGCSLCRKDIKEINNVQNVVITQTSTPMPTMTPTPTPTPTVTPTVTPMPTVTPTPTPTPTVTPTPVVTGNSVKIPVDYIAQYPEFPTGCESVSTVMALRYLGFDITAAQFIDNYLPRLDSYDDYYTGDNYNKDIVYQHYFVGNPRKDNGTACYPNVIKKAVEKYFAEIGETNLSCYDLTGTEFEDLYDELDEGNPVILWITMYLKQNPKEYSLYGKKCYNYNHTVLMTGYNEEENIVYINDPMKGSVEYDEEKVKTIYKKMSQRAAVIK